MKYIKKEKFKKSTIKSQTVISLKSIVPCQLECKLNKQLRLRTKKGLSLALNLP